MHMTLILGEEGKDRQEAWFQVTTLMHNTGDIVGWVSNYGGQDFLIHESIKERPPTRLTTLRDFNTHPASTKHE
jgi:hypothetical protein